MNFEDYVKLGKRLKAENPGKWDGNTDEEVGLVHAKHSALAMPDIEIDLRTHTDSSRSLSLNTEPFGFLTTRINHFDKQIKHISLQGQKEMAIESTQFAYAHHQQHLEQAHRQQIAQYVNTMLTIRQQAELTQLATAHQLDNASYLAWRLMQLNLMQAEETNRITAEQTARLNQIELEKTGGLDKLKRDDDAERATTRIRVITIASMADLQREKQLREQLSEARRKRFAISEGSDPPDLKQELLNDEDDYIASLEEKIGELRKANRQADSGATSGGDA